MSKVVAVASLPNCDLCELIGVTSQAKYDGKTRGGPWANMCAACFQANGVGLGTGMGQRLVLAS